MLIGLLRLFRVPWPATIETALLLGPGGEFAFIVVGLAMTKSIVEAEMGDDRARHHLVLDGADAGCSTILGRRLRAARW